MAERDTRTQDGVTLEIHTRLTGMCHFCLPLIALKEALAQQPLGAGGHTSHVSRAGIQKDVAVGTGAPTGGHVCLLVMARSVPLSVETTHAVLGLILAPLSAALTAPPHISPPWTLGAAATEVP